MSETFSLERAAAEFAALVDRAAAGEEIVIAAPGRPAVRLVAVDETAADSAATLDGGEALVPAASEDRPMRPLGLLKGQIWVGDDFDDPLPEDIMRYFRGRR